MRKGGLVGEGFEGEVKAFDGVGEGANGDEVDATFGVGADGVDGNATTGFCFRPSGNDLNCLACVLDIEVVEHDAVHATL